MRATSCPAASPTACSASSVKPLPAAFLLLGVLAACQPTVRLEAPRDPIVINLNVRIEQEVLVRLERDIEQLLEEEPDLF